MKLIYYMNNVTIGLLIVIRYLDFYIRCKNIFNIKQLLFKTVPYFDTQNTLTRYYKSILHLNIDYSFNSMNRNKILVIMNYVPIKITFKT